MTIRVGLIGCGRYCSENHAKVLFDSPDTRIVAISECVSADELTARQHQFEIPHAYSSYLEMLQSVELDAVVISTPHTRHFTQAKYCLELGLHVLIDKPVACRSSEAKILADLADSAGCHLVVASQRRYDPLLRGLRERLHSEELGELRLIELHYGRGKRTGFMASWRNDPALSGGGVLFDAGYHQLDNLLWLTNLYPLGVRGYLAPKGARTETFASLGLELERGVSANLSIHLEMPPDLVREEIGFFGSQGAYLYRRISLPGQTSYARLVTLRAGHVSDEEVQSDPGIDQAPAKNFIGAIVAQEPIKSSGRESIETVRAIEWIYRELENPSQDIRGVDDEA